MFPNPGDAYGPTDLRDGVTYEWTVYAYDEYGASSQAAERRLATVNEFGNPNLGIGSVLLVLEK